VIPPPDRVRRARRAIVAVAVVSLTMVAPADAGDAAARTPPSRAAASTQTSLRFYGSGTASADRVTVLVGERGHRANVGRAGFTIELWVRGRRSANQGLIDCSGYGWITGNVVVDRDRWPTSGADGRDFGIAVDRTGRVAFGVANATGAAHTTCTTGVDVLDDEWHHVAVQRMASTGRVRIYVDGVPRATSATVPGDVSYPAPFAGTARRWDPYLVLGAEKHDAGDAYPSFSGYVDELRVSDVVRYTAAGFAPRTRPFTVDDHTVLLFHFDSEVTGPCPATVRDSARVEHGRCRFGGAGGPRWSRTSPFADA
jgi:hypothetical protein